MHVAEASVNGDNAASVMVMACELLRTADAAEETGLRVAVFKLAFATPFVPVKVKTPVPPVDCLLMMTLVSGVLTARSMLSPAPLLFGPAHAIENVSDVMPVPVKRMEPHAVEPASPPTHNPVLVAV